MLNSQKRTKFCIANKFLGAILGICLVVSGCAKSDPVIEETPDFIDQNGTAIEVEIDETDYSEFFNKKIEMIEDTTAYRYENGSFIECGEFKKKALLDLADTQDKGLVQIKGSDFYVAGKSVADSGRYYHNDNRLIAYPEILTTNDSYTIYSVFKRKQYEGKTSDQYPVYVLPTEDDPRYGILFNNAIYYILADDVKEITETGEKIADTANEIPVLMYHFFYDESLGQTRKEGNFVEVKEFDQQLSYIEDNGYTCLTMREVQYFMEERALVPPKSIAITIDDADDTVYQYGFKVLKNHQLRATLFVICGWQGPEMPWSLWEMRENGIELQSHGFLTHQSGCKNMGHGGRLLCMPYEDGVDDTKLSFEFVDGGFVYCYPFGDFNEHAKTIIRDAGAKLAFTTQHGKINPSMDLLELPRIRVTGGNSLESFAASIR